MTDLKWIGAKMHNVKVIFDDGDYCYTKINGTEEIVKSYYLGKSFPFMEKGKEIGSTVAAMKFSTETKSARVVDGIFSAY